MCERFSNTLDFASDALYDYKQLKGNGVRAGLLLDKLALIKEDLLKKKKAVHYNMIPVKINVKVGEELPKLFDTIDYKLSDGIYHFKVYEILSVEWSSEGNIVMDTIGILSNVKGER